ncbi:DUF1641 domain-containing protein [Paludibaculum fermentans]|uniref:DUF1641 domain-containing protein n=1 Tax=Paludibaculum fermentans TaxID=1473598 RepID=UPI003EB81AB9
MAQAIAFEPQPKDASAREVLTQGTPRPHTDALLSAYDLLQVLHERGVLDMVRGLVGARDEVTGILASAVCSPESIRGIRNFLLLTKFFAGIPPEVLQSLVQTVNAGAEREKSQEAPGLGALLLRLRNKDSRHAVAVMLDLLEAVGKGL